MRFLRRDTYEPGVMASGRNFARMWVVEIWGRDDLESSKVIAQGADLARTLEAAVRSAEGKFAGR